MNLRRKFIDCIEIDFDVQRLNLRAELEIHSYDNPPRHRIFLCVVHPRLEKDFSDSELFGNLLMNFGYLPRETIKFMEFLQRNEEGEETFTSNLFVYSNREDVVVEANAEEEVDWGKKSYSKAYILSLVEAWYKLQMVFFSIPGITIDGEITGNLDEATSEIDARLSTVTIVRRIPPTLP